MVHPGPCCIGTVSLDPAQQAKISGFLKKAGYAVSVYAEVDEALAAASATPPDLFICGLSAPHLEGLRLCRLLRSAGDSRHPRIPVLLLSTDLSGEEVKL